MNVPIISAVRLRDFTSETHETSYYSAEAWNPQSRRVQRGLHSHQSQSLSLSLSLGSAERIVRSLPGALLLFDKFTIARRADLRSVAVALPLSETGIQAIFVATNLKISCDCFRMTGNSAAHRQKNMPF